MDPSLAYLGIFATVVMLALGLFALAHWLSRPAERDEHEDGV